MRRTTRNAFICAAAAAVCLGAAAPMAASAATPAADPTVSFADEPGAAPTTANALDSGPTALGLLEQCDHGTDVCIFHPSGRQTFPGQRHQVGRTAYNCSAVNQQESIAWSDQTGGSNSLGVTITGQAEFAKVYSASVAAAYEHQWNWSRTEVQTDILTIQGGHIGRIYHAPELQRVPGQYELHFGSPYYGHYYWYVNFEATGPTEDAAGAVIFVTAPMSAEDWKHCPR